MMQDLAAASNLPTASVPAQVPQMLLSAEPVGSVLPDGQQATPSSQPDNHAPLEADVEHDRIDDKMGSDISRSEVDGMLSCPKVHGAQLHSTCMDHGYSKPV